MTPDLSYGLEREREKERERERIRPNIIKGKRKQKSKNRKGHAVALNGQTSRVFVCLFVCLFVFADNRVERDRGQAAGRRRRRGGGSDGGGYQDLGPDGRQVSCVCAFVLRIEQLFLLLCTLSRASHTHLYPSRAAQSFLPG